MSRLWPPSAPSVPLVLKPSAVRATWMCWRSGTESLSASSPASAARRSASSALRLASSSRSEEHTSELQSHSDLHSFPTRRSSDLHLDVLAVGHREPERQLSRLGRAAIGLLGLALGFFLGLRLQPGLFFGLLLGRHL